MSAENTGDSKFDIGHVLFIDVVGYSRLSGEDQKKVVRQLNDIVRGTPEFRRAEAANHLVRLPVGDGMALVFFASPEAPVQCALEIGRALKQHPHIQLRMGINSGPIDQVEDVNNRTNVSGTGINMAQRVMSCGDAGHILLARRIADDLAQYEKWRPYLCDLGDVEIKHGVKIDIVSFCFDGVGNSGLPDKIKQRRRQQKAARRKRLIFGTSLILAALLMAWAARHQLQKRADVLAAIPQKSIAVLPFENLSPNPENAFFVDGVQDEISTYLAKIADLKVISRISVMQYKAGISRNAHAIGQALGVAHLLEGSVQRDANRVRVNAQLIDARTDAHLWGQTYDRDLADVFAIQSEIAKAIADQLQAKLSANEKRAIQQPPTLDVTAYDLYSRARMLILTANFSAARREKMLQAVDLLNQALARDPSFFVAQCLLAYSHDQLYLLGNEHTPERLALAELAVEAAFRLRPDAGEAHLARAEHLYRGYLDYAGALAELEIARRTLPNNPHVFELAAYIARRQGKHEEALRSLDRAFELDPRNYFIPQQMALSYGALRRYAEQAAILDRALAINPNDVHVILWRAGVELNWKADTRPLHQAIDAIRAQNPTSLAEVANDWFTCALAERDAPAVGRALLALEGGNLGLDAMYLSRSFGEGLAARMTNDDAKARAAFMAARTEQEKRVQAQPNYGPALCVLGLIDAALGRKEEALREGRRAIELLPVEKDAINGGHIVVHFAIIAAWTGEKDLACEQLAIAARVPLFTINYGSLKLLPYWDPLRGRPCFEKIVASLAPKD
jgi:TolB-like protein/Tfp pilus assembly protein PilF